MKKKIFTLLTLLATVCSGAWGTTYVSQDYSSGTADWTSGNTDRYTVAVDGHLTVNAVGNGDSGALITGTTVNGALSAGDDFASSTDFTMTFDLQLNGGNGQPSAFIISDPNGGTPNVNTNDYQSATNRLLILNQSSANSTTWTINGNADQTVTLTKSTWYSFQLSKKGSMLYLTVTPTAGGDAVFEQAAITVTSTVGGTGKMYFATKRWYSFMAIDNVVLRDWQSGDTPAGTATTYTITYKNESGTTIADAVEGNGLVGDVVTASAAQMADVTYSDQKYIYKSGNTNITLVADAASNVINLVYREANTYTYKLKSSLGTVFANGSGAENDVVYVPFAQYELSGTTLYSTSNDGTDGYYRNKYILTANVDETKTYTEDIHYVKYFSEGEDITGATSSSSDNADIRCSMAAGGYFSSDANLITLPAGCYRITAQVWGGSGTTFTFNAGDTKVFEITTTGALASSTSNLFQLTEETTIKVLTAGSSSRVLDWVYITGCTFETNSDVTSVIQNYDFEKSKDGWSSADNATNSRIWPVSNFTNTSGAFSGTNAYENYVAGSLTGKMAQTITGLPDGAYKFELAAFATTAGGQFVYAKSNGVTAQAPLTENAQTKAYSVNIYVSGGTLEVGLDMNGATCGWAGIDNAKLTYYGTTVSKTMTSAGWATYCSPYALDFTSVDGLTAYQITGASGSTLTLEGITGTVAANTGILLAGAAGSYTIPVVATGTDYSSSNKLVGVTAETEKAANSIYVLMNGGNGVGFYSNNNAFTVGANTAYLNYSDFNAAREFYLFEGEATGINQIDNGQLTIDNSFFDLQGRRVAQPTKGLYIVNGKKVIVK